MIQQPQVDHVLLMIETSRSHSLDTPQSVGLLWTSDQPDQETSTWYRTTLTRDRGFEHTIPASKRSQTRALDRAGPWNQQLN